MFVRLIILLTGLAAALTIGLFAAPTVNADPPNHCGFGSHPDCPPDINVMVGTRFNDVMLGTSGPDAMFGKRGNDRMRGALGDDALFGMAGNDRLRGGPGADVLRGGTGFDICVGDSQDRFRYCERIVRL